MSPKWKADHATRIMIDYFDSNIVLAGKPAAQSCAVLIKVHREQDEE